MAGYQTASQKDVERFLGDANLLVEQLGASDEMASLAVETGSFILPQITDRASLRNFLFAYQTRILAPFELPVIQKAFLHANRSEARELIQLDQRIGAEAALQCFGAASRQIGKSQLRRLRPLRDQRVLQRYITAVHSGTAHGWHTVVYGLVLALYSLPLRPGLLSYAQQAAHGWVYSSAKRLNLSEVECRDLISESCSSLPAAVEQLVAEFPQPPTQSPT
jgi:urease accessory protein UreF